MQPKFVRYHPVVRRSDREKMMFVLAAVVALALLSAMVLVLNSRTEANAPITQRQSPVEPIRPAIGTVTLWAPDSSVAPGTKLSNVKFKEVYWPRNNVPEGAIRDLAEVRELYAKSVLAANMPLNRNSLSSSPSDAPLPVSKGRRAISIEVDATSGLEGHALPGSRVDVLLTFVKDSNKTTKIIVQNAKVLSYGGSVESDPMLVAANAVRSVTARRTPSSTITLEVLPSDALKIQNARSMGRLGLMMRSLDDTNAAEITEIGEMDVSGDKQVKRVPTTEANCTKGSVRIDGREFSVGCDGRVSEILNPNEP